MLHIDQTAMLHMYMLYYLLMMHSCYCPPFCILRACTLLLAKHMLRLTVASWVAMVSLEWLPIAFEDRLLTCFLMVNGVREFYSLVLWALGVMDSSL